MNENEAQSLLSLCERAAPELIGLDASIWRERIEARSSELEPALRCLIDAGRSEEALRLASALPHFWMATGRYAEGRELLERALAPAGEEHGDVRARAYFDAGLLAFWAGEDERARKLFSDGRDLGRRVTDATGIALALTGLARLALREGELELAAALCTEALNECASAENPLGRSNAIHVLGVVAQMSGQLEHARKLMGQRLALARETGNYLAIAVEASNLSAVERQLGNLRRAEELATEATRIGVRLGDEWSMPYNLNSLAAIAAERGEPERAARLLAAADAEVTRQGATWPPDELQHFEGTRARLIADLPQTTFEELWNEGASWSIDVAISRALDSR
jgi:ATP/maltotriose-dependent transcriptional regulator MalT